jgi:hypothetical protein
LALVAAEIGPGSTGTPDLIVRRWSERRILIEALAAWPRGSLLLLATRPSPTINRTNVAADVYDHQAETTQWRNEKITRAKQILANVRDYERREMPVSAEAEFKKLIPAN